MNFSEFLKNFVVLTPSLGSWNPGLRSAFILPLDKFTPMVETLASLYGRLASYNTQEKPQIRSMFSELQSSSMNYINANKKLQLTGRRHVPLNPNSPFLRRTVYVKMPFCLFDSPSPSRPPTSPLGAAGVCWHFYN